MGIINYIRQKIAEFSQNLSTAQKVTMILVTGLFIAFVISLVRWATQPDFTLLFTGLEPEDAQQITEDLRSSNTKYKIDDGGRSILVPKKQVYELRMKYAAQDIPTTGGIGYEIFDKKDIGISEFVQQVNYRRALEGELGRTIQTIPEINRVRVHIVFPKERLFKEDQKEPTASIFLVIRGGATLNNNQIQGIARLVASSIEGLSAENVTIVDSHGTILTKSRGDRDDIAGLSDNQLDIQRRVESYLEDKAQSMFDEVLGAGNAIVRVRAELDFKQIETTSEKYDPDNTAVLSEEVQEESLADSGGAPLNTLERTITNYQVTKSVEHIVNNVGDIKRLTVAVLVNGSFREIQNEQGETVKEYVPRTDEEINRLADLIRTTVGFNSARNDQFTIENIQFDTPEIPDEGGFLSDFNQNNIYQIIEKVATGIGILLLFFIFRSQYKKAKVALGKMNHLGYGHRLRSLPAGRTRVERAPDVPSLESEIPETTIERTEKQAQVMNFVNEKPSMAARLIRYWLMEG